MRTPEEIFRDYCAEEQLVPFSPSENLRSLFESYRFIANDLINAVCSLFLPGRNIDIYLDFNDGPSLNASAAIREFVGIISINKGTVLLPADMFQRMLSHPDILPNIGNVGLEFYGGQYSEGIINNIDELHESRKRNSRPIEPRLPNDPIRQQFSIAVSRIVYEFMVCHEIAHIVLGQLDYIYCTAGIRELYEAFSGLPSHRAKTVRQAIELGADNLAIGLTLKNIWRWKGAMPQYWAEFFTTPEQRIYLWCFSIVAVFRLWGLKTDLIDVYQQNYPPVAMRCFAAIGIAELFVKDSNSSIEFKRIADQAFNDLSRAIELIGGPKLKAEEFDIIYSHEGKAHFTRIRKCMTKLLPRFSKYRYVHLVGDYGD